MPTRYKTRSVTVAAAKFRKRQSRKRGFRSDASILRRRRDRVSRTLQKRRDCRKAKSQLEQLTESTTINLKQTVVRGTGAPESMTSSSEAVKIPAMCNVKKDYFVSPRKSTIISTFNTRTLKTQWKRNELIAYCIKK